MEFEMEGTSPQSRSTKMRRGAKKMQRRKRQGAERKNTRLNDWKFRWGL